MLILASGAREKECVDCGEPGRGGGGECILASARRGPMGKRATLVDILLFDDGDDKR